MSRYSIIRKIREEDPEYDPVPLALENSGVSRALFGFCENYIISDGYFGPIGFKRMFEESSPKSRGLTRAETKEIKNAKDPRAFCLSKLRSVANEFLDYKEYTLAVDDDGNEYEELECTVTARELAEDRFYYVREIYGDGIFMF